MTITTPISAAPFPPGEGEALTLIWSGLRLVSANEAAEGAVAAGSGGDDLARLLTGLCVSDEAFARGLRLALTAGRAFEGSTTRACGGRVAASARPDGRHVSMSLNLSRASADDAGLRDLARAAENATHPIWLRGPDGRSRWRNGACQRHGLDPEDAVLRATGATAAATGATQSLHISGAGDQSLVATESPGGLGFAHASTPPITASTISSDAGVASAAMRRLTAGVAVFGGGRRLIYANDAFAGFWDLSREFLSDRPRIEAMLDRMRDSGRLPSVANYPCWREEVSEWADPLAEAPAEDDWHLADGSALRIERSMDDAARVVLSIRDITAQIALERRIRRVADTQRKTLDALDDGVALFDLDGRIRLVNPAFADLWGLSPSRIGVGVHIGSLPAPDEGHASRAWAALRRAVTGGAPDAAKQRFHLGGKVLEASAAPLPDGAILARVDDRTAAERAETALRERSDALAAAAELRAALADCASVKLRTALTSISGFAELISLDCEDRGLRAQSKAILAATAEMAEAVAELEQLAADPSDGEADAGAPVSAGDLLSLTSDLLSRALWTAEVRLETRDLSDGAEFSGDPESLRQIALAMALAALDDLPRGATLHLTATRRELDALGGVSAVLVADSVSQAPRPAPGERLARALDLADRIGASLLVKDQNGERRITLTGAAR